MRISDWSSDVCSSDLPARRLQGNAVPAIGGVAGDIDDAAEAVDGVALDEELREGDGGADGVAPEGLARLGHQRLGEARRRRRSEEHTSELQSLMRISYAVFCLKKKKVLLMITSHNYNSNRLHA